MKDLKPYQYIYVTYFPLDAKDMTDVDNILIASAREHGVHNPVISGCTIGSWTGQIPDNANIGGVYWWAGDNG